MTAARVTESCPTAVQSALLEQETLEKYSVVAGGASACQVLPASAVEIMASEPTAMQFVAVAQETALSVSGPPGAD